MVIALSDTIVAPITGLGPSAVAIVRLCGEDAFAITRQWLGDWNPQHAKAKFTQLPNLDEGYVLSFQAPRSYTGEDTVEFMIHGSPASIDLLLNALIDLGARMAQPGEFAQRAFLNGKVDLDQAEGIRDTVEAQTEQQLKAANAFRTGLLGQKVKEIRAQLVEIQTQVEARVDFLEEIGELDFEETEAGLLSCLDSLEALLKSAHYGQIVRNGFKIALAGLPNAGKSSLFNALLKRNRAIVSNIPGTTRDTLEESLDLSGYRVILFDTAGMRESEDEVEKIGVELSRSTIEASQLVLYIYDASVPWSQADDELCNSINKPKLLIANKADLGYRSKEGLKVSATTGLGLEHIAENIVQQIQSLDHGGVTVNPRHAEVLESVRGHVQASLDVLTYNRPVDLMSVTLKDAIRGLGEITGETKDPAMIDQIFSSFCLGK